MTAYGIPSALAACIWAGLVLCLLGDGWLDAIGVALIAVAPVTAWLRQRALARSTEERTPAR